jgi:hypothetical protein
MSEELKPCAHCSSDAVNYRPTDDHESQMIECRSCGSAIQDLLASKSELFSMWNKRPSITLDQVTQVLAEAGVVAVPIEDCTHAANTMGVRNSAEEAAHYRFMAIDDAAQ